MGKTVVVVSKPAKAEVEHLAPELCAWLEQRKYTVLVDPETAMHVPDRKSVKRSEIAEHKPALVIVLGGDGTLLAAARATSQIEVPILAVNLGSLGFLTEVTREEVYSTIECWEQNKCAHERRAMLRCTVMRRGEKVAEYQALNDVVVSKSTIARMTEVDVMINDVFVANYKADGVIVSTPTGSTAYSLAAGGPVLEPSVDAFVITPVSPHALTNRPLVVRDSAKITLTVKSTPDEAFLTVDGQSGMEVLEGDRVVCERSAHEVHLVRAQNRTFFDVLRSKLKWGER